MLCKGLVRRRGSSAVAFRAWWGVPAAGEEACGVLHPTSQTRCWLELPVGISEVLVPSRPSSDLSKFHLLLETLDVWPGCLLDAPESLQEGRESRAWRWQELREPVSLRQASWLQHRCFS